MRWLSNLYWCVESWTLGDSYAWCLVWIWLQCELWQCIGKVALCFNLFSQSPVFVFKRYLENKIICIYVSCLCFARILKGWFVSFSFLDSLESVHLAQHLVLRWVHWCALPFSNVAGFKSSCTSWNGWGSFAVCAGLVPSLSISA